MKLRPDILIIDLSSELSRPQRMPIVVPLSSKELYGKMPPAPPPFVNGMELSHPALDKSLLLLPIPVSLMKFNCMGDIIIDPLTP